MKRKIISMLLVVTMILSVSSLAFAAEIAEETSVEFDMMVREHRTATWLNGPISAGSLTVDYKTEMNPQAIKARIAELLDENSEYMQDPALQVALNAKEMVGEFVITIETTNPANVSIPDAVKDGAVTTDMTDFSTADYADYTTDPNRIFHQVSREYTDNKLVITIGTNKPGDVTQPLCIGDLIDLSSEDSYDDQISKYFPTLTLTCLGIKFANTGATYTTSATMEGTVTFSVLGDDYTETFVGVQKSGYQYQNNGRTDISASVMTPGTTTTVGGNSSNRNPIPSTSGTVSVVVDGVTIDVDNSTGDKYANDIIYGAGKEDGTIIYGLFYDAEMTQPVAEGEVIPSGTTLYAYTAETVLNTKDHYAYIVGYPDGNVYPESYITREEVATVFYRLLGDEKRAAIASKENNFSDVDASRWSNNAISTMANGGYILGYADGTFRPENNITRAEFAAMATRFATLNKVGNLALTDVAGHWAEESILKAATAGWITGYENGTFKPEQEITRAEAMAIINRILLREVDADGLLGNATYWNDNDVSAWYYYIVLEATNSHSYVRNSESSAETWTSINANRDWTELEN